MEHSKRFIVLVAKRGEEHTPVQMMNHTEIQTMLTENRWGVVDIVSGPPKSITNLQETFVTKHRGTNVETVVMVIEGIVVAPRLELVIPPTKATRGMAGP